MAALPKHLAHAKQNAPGWARILKDVDAAAVRDRAALAKLPVTRKSELSELQKMDPPLGGLSATPVAKLAKIFVSPGPVYDPEGHGRDWWRTGARSTPRASGRAISC
jgi:phenylacetate-CoA ligase